MDKYTLHKWQDKIFTFLINISYLLIVISSLGLSEWAPKYLSDLDYYLRIYICLFLMWRFHPFRTHYVFTDLDRKIAFSAGAFILTTTALNQYVEQVKSGIMHIFKQ